MSSAEPEVIDGDAVHLLRQPWLDLWERGRGDPFQHPDWILAWWDIFRPGPAAIACVREDDGLVALAPFYRDPASGLALAMGAGPSDRTDVLLDPTSPGVAKRLAAEIVRVAGACGVFWPDAPLDGGVAGLAAPRGWTSETAAGSPCPVIDLSQGLAAVPSTRWRKWRMAGHRAARRGDVTIAAAGALGADAFAERLIALNAERFDPAAGGVFGDPRMAAFVRRAVPALAAAGVLDGLVMSIGDIVVGVQCGFTAAGRTYAWLGGFDPRFSFESPGTLLMGEAVRRAVARGDGHLDLLRGDEAYKAGWGAADRPLLRVHWRRSDDA
jgi:CelD/BcsL family acetyltransferase involved in cellulose biosynthesis